MYRKQFCLSFLALVQLLGFNSPGAFCGEFRESDVQDALKGLDSPDLYERKSAAYKLTEMGKSAGSAVPKLTELLGSEESAQVKGEIAHALGNIGARAESSVPAIIAFLKSRDGGYERTYAASALGDIGQRADLSVPVLIETLQNDEEPVVRQLSARALGDFHEKASSAIPALVDSIQKGNRDLRNAAADGLAEIPATEKDLSALTTLLADEIDSARIAAAKSLAFLGPKAAPALPALLKLLKDENRNAKVAGLKTISAIGSEARAAIPDLKQALSDPELHEDAEKVLSAIK